MWTGLRKSFCPEGTTLMVAWQFIARDAHNKTTRPVGHGLSWSTRPFAAYGSRSFPPTQSHRTLRDGSFLASVPGSKLPGYLHYVPSGQNSSSTLVRKIEATPRGASPPTSLSYLRDYFTAFGTTARQQVAIATCNSQPATLHHRLSSL